MNDVPRAAWERYKPSAQWPSEQAFAWRYAPGHQGPKACDGKPEYEARFRFWSTRKKDWTPNGYAVVNLCRDCAVNARRLGILHDDCAAKECGWYLQTMQDVREPEVACFGRSRYTEDVALILDYMGRFRLGRYVR